MIKPISSAVERSNEFKANSDRDFFDGLMFLGELLVKLTTLGFVACVDEGKDRSNYSLLYRLVRTDGVGGWADVMAEILQGPISQNLSPVAYPFQGEMVSRFGSGSWQHDCATAMREALRELGGETQPVDQKIQLLSVFRDFAAIRNASRGHGAYDSVVLGKVARHLERSLNLLIANLSVLNQPWVHLFENLSGKYRVTSLCFGEGPYAEYRKRPPEQRFANGIYLAASGVGRRVELVQYDLETGSFYVANGGFNGKRFELLCYSTGEKVFAEAVPYMHPPGQLPASETAALKDLRIVGDCLTNAPLGMKDYVTRSELEEELFRLLDDDRHLIVTLHGRGGIGKTSLALSVVESIAGTGRFGQVSWLSARDIDLLPQGPKKVQADATTVEGFAMSYVAAFSGEPVKPARARQLLELAMSTKGGEGTLFVFDNFETVAFPGEVFVWIDTHLRPPNKALITTRIREFKGDWPITVEGMIEAESNSLAEKISKSLKLNPGPSAKDLEELFEESSGHPYIIRMMMGDFATCGRLRKISTAAIGSDEILKALFERTMSQLSAGAIRVFLTCASWNSTIPVDVVEGVLLARDDAAGLDVERALEDLHLSSMIEIRRSQFDSHEYVYVPLIAQMFAKSKLALSPYRAAVEFDLRVLHGFGAYSPEDRDSSLRKRLDRFIGKVANEALLKPESLERNRGIIKLLAAKAPHLWLTLAQLEQEHGVDRQAISRARDAITQYLERSSSDHDSEPGNFCAAWIDYFRLSEKLGDEVGMVNAILGVARLPGVPLAQLSKFASDYNRLLYSQQIKLDSVAKNSTTQALANAMELAMKNEEPSAVDYSRLGWLVLRQNRQEKALELAKLGLLLDPDDEHCRKLEDRLLK
jgi:hypothetical protein